MSLFSKEKGNALLKAVGFLWAVRFLLQGSGQDVSEVKCVIDNFCQIQFSQYGSLDFKDKDSYGNNVTFLARPMPIEYVLIEVPAAFPQDHQYQYTFSQGNGASFPIANREELGEIQVRVVLLILY